MSFGKMNTFINIILAEQINDDEGFATTKSTVIASVRAYKEERHSTEKWANRAVFSEATALFRFRIIPNIEITTRLIIVCDDCRYDILSAENVKGRGMYIEVLAKKVEDSSG